MITCEHLRKVFGKKVAVEDVSFSIGEGELFALLGSNGAGKSTTIKMILGLSKKDGGTAAIRENKTIGYSPETPFFPPFLTAPETLRYYCGLQRFPKSRTASEIDRVMELVHLDDRETKVKNFSKGMQQRLAMAQALIGDPDFLILDEPTAGLDALGRVEMINILQNFKRAGKTILLNSHILSDVERVCDRAIIMKSGRALREWTKEYDNHKTLEEIFIETVGGMTL